MALERLFAWLDRLLGGGPPPSASSGLASAPGPAPMTRPPRAQLDFAALLSVDGAGQFLLCGAERLTLGHLRAGEADLGFLADVGALHAALVRSDSLHEGPGWRVVPCAGERVTVDGRATGERGARLPTGALVRLGENLELRLSAPDAASASAMLELLHGAECCGARHILLCARGAGGRVRIGSSLACHVRVANLECELELEWHGETLLVRSDEPLEGAPGVEGGRLAFPPRERIALTFGRPRGSRPPFGISLEPVERPVAGRRGP